jgi:glycerol-3-phosphate O-acyltransferase
MLRGFDPAMDRDITFIPIGINYDRVLEDRSLLRSLDPSAEKRSMWFVLKTSLGFLGKSVLLMLTSRWRRFGHACVNFGPPLSMRQHCHRHGLNFKRMDQTARFDAVAQISRQLMDAIRQVIPVLPVPLVAMIFVRRPDQSFSALDIEHQANRLIAEIQNQDAPIFVSSYSRIENIIAALDMLTIRHLVIEADGMYRADPQMLDILSYYANAIVHWFTASEMQQR